MTHRPLKTLLALVGAGLFASLFLWNAGQQEKPSQNLFFDQQAKKIPVIGAHNLNAVAAERQAGVPLAKAASATRELQSMRRDDARSTMLDAPPPRITTTDDTPPDFHGIGIELVKTRQLPSLPASTEMMSREDVERRIAQWLATQFPPDYGKRFGRALAALGAIPQAVDTVALKAAFLSYQIGAWYDSDGDALRVMEASGETGQKENALGLAYGNVFRSFGATLFEHPKQLTTDARLARESLIAGDAALVRLLHSLANPGKGGGGGVGEDPDDPSRAVPIPHFLREMEMVPFGTGLRFAQSLHSLGGFDQLNAAYQRPPASCIEVWNAQSYLADTPFSVAQTSWKNVSIAGNQPIWDDTLGALCLVLYLKQHIPDRLANEVAAAWSGDRFLVYAAEGKTRDHAVWQTRWRDRKAADAFFVAMQQHLASRYKGATPLLDVTGMLTLNTGDRSVLLKRTHQGSGVLFIDAADPAFVKQSLETLGAEH